MHDQTFTPYTWYEVWCVSPSGYHYKIGGAPIHTKQEAVESMHRICRWTKLLNDEMESLDGTKPLEEGTSIYVMAVTRTPLLECMEDMQNSCPDGMAQTVLGEST